MIPRPSLLGAIVSKAVAVQVDDAPEAQRQDLALLLSLVADPLAMSAQMTAKDRTRLRARSDFGDPALQAWRSLSPEGAARGRATYTLLAR